MNPQPLEVKIVLSLTFLVMIFLIVFEYYLIAPDLGYWLYVILFVIGTLAIIEILGIWNMRRWSLIALGILVLLVPIPLIIFLFLFSLYVLGIAIYPILLIIIILLFFFVLKNLWSVRKLFK